MTTATDSKVEFKSRRDTVCELAIGGKTAASVLVHQYEETGDWFVYRLYVRPEFRGQGYARQLMMMRRCHLKSWSVSTGRLDSIDAVIASTCCSQMFESLDTIALTILAVFCLMTIYVEGHDSACDQFVWVREASKPKIKMSGCGCVMIPIALIVSMVAGYTIATRF